MKKTHVEFHGCIVRKGKYGGFGLDVGEAITVDGPRKKGEELNLDLIKGRLGPMFRDWLNNAEPGASIEIGNLYVGVGAMPIISCGFDFEPLSAIDLPLDLERDIDMADRIVERFGQPVAIGIAVVRDWTAPRMYGRLEGGVAGMFEATTDPVASSFRTWPTDLPLGYGEIVRAINYHIFKELAEEIGIGIHTCGKLGWVGFNQLSWLNDSARQAWNADNKPAELINLEELPGSDWVNFSNLDYGESRDNIYLDNVSLAFETRRNATVEIMRIYKLGLNPRCKYTFIDREKMGGKYIDRKIALVGFGEPGGGGHDFIVYFQDGVFDMKSLGDIIDENFLESSCNTKFVKLYHVIKQLIIDRNI